MYDTTYLSYVWQRGHLHSLGRTTTLPRVRAVAINSSGTVVGAEEYSAHGLAPDRVGNAYLWNRGRKKALPPLVWKGQTADATFATGINAQGVVVGSSGPDADFSPGNSLPTSRAVVWQDGKIKDLGYGGADAINNRGQIVGSYWTSPGQEDEHAELWDHGRRVPLAGEEATAINNHGDVVGSGDANAFLYSHGKTIFLGQGDAVAINDRRQVLVAGNSVLGETGTSHVQSYLWHNGTRQNINTLVPALAKWSNITVSGLNNHGAIIGYGMLHKQNRAFLLVPTRSR